MGIVYILLPLSICLALVGLVGYFWCIKSGQYEDLEGPAARVLKGDD